jgi:hypothetical protein
MFNILKLLSHAQNYSLLLKEDNSIDGVVGDTGPDTGNADNYPEGVRVTTALTIRRTNANVNSNC